MRLSATVGFLALLCHLALTGAWDLSFKRKEMCYNNELRDLQERMPMSMRNLVALLEKYESEHTYQNYDAIAEALVNRYRIDGITYASMQSGKNWDRFMMYDVYKSDILGSIYPMTEVVPEFTYEPREECSMHFMLSHSVDLYPHAGMDYVWDESNTYYRRQRRQAQSQSRFGGLPQNIQPAQHPIENGVIWTLAGPVAAGTLLQGIMVTDNTQGKSISTIFSADNLGFMPTEMQQKYIQPLYASTLSGDIGQSALVGYATQVASSNVYLGPTGRFANDTAAPKLFTLKTSYDFNVPYMTRAEIFAGIDSLLIQKVLMETSNSQLTLSKALRMYYSNHGLPGYPEYKACNRMAAFKSLDRMDVIKDQALNFMYAYSEKIPSVRDEMNSYKDDVTRVESAFRNALSLAWSQFENFVTSYDHSDYDPCPTYSWASTPSESEVDLLAVHSPEGGETESQKQRDYIAHLGQFLDVGVDRSRIGVMDGKKGDWIFPMTNYSNVADWGSNFSHSLPDNYVSAGSSDMLQTLAALTTYYDGFYRHLLSNANNASANAQIVLWNAPSNVPNQEDFEEMIASFRLNYPDVYFLFVGKNKGSFSNILLDEKLDFMTLNTQQDLTAFSNEVAHRIWQIPTLFTYPACDPSNSNFTNIAESSHTYTGYVSPNYTTYIKIPPNYFHFSESLLLSVTEGNVKVCSSRTSMSVDSNEDDYMCSDSNDLDYWHLCGRYLDQCDPIYLAVTGSSSQANTNCQDLECQYPNQIKFEIKHDGMTCGSWAAAPSLLAVAVALLVSFFQQQP